jgi:hypothetical protein
VPFVDALNTLLDRSLPLTESSFSEFGNPADSKADFLNIQAYSPYDSVRAQAYPPMLVYQGPTTRACPTGRRPNGCKLRQLKTEQQSGHLFIKMRRSQRQLWAVRHARGLRQGLCHHQDNEVRPRARRWILSNWGQTPAIGVGFCS